MSADHSLLDLPEESRVDLAKELKQHGWKKKELGVLKPSGPTSVL